MFSFMFTLIKVVTAVFIAETTRVANIDDKIAVQRKNKQKEQFCTKLNQVFLHLDSDQDGSMARDEFQSLITNATLTTLLSTIDIDTHDLVTLLHMYTQGSERFDVHRFIEGTSHVKGPAQSIDVLKVLASIDTLNEKVGAALRNRPGK